MNLSVSPIALSNEYAPIPFALPDIGEEEIAEVAACMRSGWLTSGPKVREFEAAFAKMIGGGTTAVAVNSATEGLLLALEAVGVRAGDEVITTAYTFSATAMSIFHLGAVPVLVDIDPVTLNIDPVRIEKAITSKTKAIVPVHFAGLACDMGAILDIAKRHKLKVVEDAAHALPTTYRGTLIGALDTDACVYSFYATKPITTGEGGMIVTKHPDIAKRCQMMRLHGISRDVFDRYTSVASHWHYEITAPGYKCNMTDIEASMGIVQLQKAYAFQKRRAEIKSQYVKAFASLPVTLPAESSAGDMHAWHLFVLQVHHPTLSRDTFITRMKSEFQIGCSVHFIPLPMHPFWKNTLQVKPEDFPVATKVFSRVVSLPLYTKMTSHEVERVIEAVQTILAV